ncbi:MAG: outer membrane protein assembly factor BamE [Alphaproteobacteria bacterium]|nr:outer membrane protein assembly factor BamE [Alphaproteobacteria bacterium]MDE2012469.1 outer membrane protein assembly factor BamE [Alphaproteobacteria bacterium]MDE2074608.1 outer membrane protein assembly factor BamE [Alphaproteobacteria bacterium]MDE2351859.1 outer membrane protein assembly factor BamE [Alphaproteobacteria bacterium]
MSSSMRVPARLPILALAAALLIGCTPVVNQRGYLPDPVAEASIDVGKDTQTTIQEKLGDPSTRSTFNGSAWYYISSVQKQIAFFDPVVESRSILEVHFDKAGKVDNLRHFGLKDGHVVAFETRETPTRGRTLTFLQQLLNATPGAPISGSGGMGGERNPGGGNGP